MDISWIIAFPITLIAVAIVAMAVSLLRRLQQRWAFREVAERLGMTWEGQGAFDPGRVVGRRGADEVIVDFGTDARSSFARSVTVVEMRLVPPIDVRYQIGREDALSRVQRLAGVEDVVLGDPDLDALLKIRARDVERLRIVFTERARRILKGLAREVGDLRFEPDHMVVTWTGRVVDPSPIERAVVELIDAAAELRRHHGAS